MDHGTIKTERQGKGKIDLLEGKTFLVGDLTVVKLLWNNNPGGAEGLKQWLSVLEACQCHLMDF